MTSKSSQAFISDKRHRKIFQELLASSSSYNWATLPNDEFYQHLRPLLILCLASDLKVLSPPLQRVLKNLLKQVSGFHFPFHVRRRKKLSEKLTWSDSHWKICADDSALALVPRKAHADLEAFAQNSFSSPSSLLLNEVSAFGTFYRALEKHTKSVPTSPPPPPSPLTSWDMVYVLLRRLAGWMHERSQRAWTSLDLHLPADPTTIPEPDWATSGSCYGLPQVRKRSKYPGIVNDQGVSQADRVTDVLGNGAGSKNSEPRCNKFYDAERKLRMNGGIMVLWCPHSICLGFHVIRTGEGRDDVFSAVYTR